MDTSTTGCPPIQRTLRFPSAREADPAVPQQCRVQQTQRKGVCKPAPLGTAGTTLFWTIVIHHEAMCQPDSKEAQQEGRGCAPSTSALQKGRPAAGTVRRMGCSREKHSTGAATLVIHMLAKVATCHTGDVIAHAWEAPEAMDAKCRHSAGLAACLLLTHLPAEGSCRKNATPRAT